MQNGSSAGPAGPSPRLARAAATPNGSFERKSLAEPRAGGRGAAAACLCFRGPAAHTGRRRRGWPGATRESGARPSRGRTPGIVPDRATASAPGAQAVGPRATTTNDASVFVLPELAGELPSPDTAIRGPLGLRRRPRPPRPSTLTPGPEPAPSAAPLTLRGPECRSRGRARRRRDRAGPRPPGRTSRAPGAAATGQERVGAAGGGGGAAAAAGSFFVPAAAPSVAGTRRSSGSGRREAGGGCRGGGGGRTGGHGC